MENISSTILHLQDWFQKNKRDFPWRKNPTPYAVWVSEVMLQQTRASVVVSYFTRWMERFPTVGALSHANIEEIIKLWEGLGYYQRARNLFYASQQIVKEFAGEIPSLEKDLRSIKGIGPYTMGAILSFGFKKAKSALDANAFRVLSRLFLVQDNIDLVGTKKIIEKYCETLLEEKNPSETMEAIIEIGATVCLPKPKCFLCPINFSCKGYQNNQQNNLPIKNKRKKTIFLKRVVFVFQKGKKYLIFKEKQKKIMEDLYQFPFLDLDKKEINISELIKKIREIFGFENPLVYPLEKLKQSFTKYIVELIPFLIEVKEEKAPSHCIWTSLEEMQELPFSSGHRKILHTLNI